MDSAYQDVRVEKVEKIENLINLHNQISVARRNAKTEEEVDGELWKDFFTAIRDADIINVKFYEQGYGGRVTGIEYLYQAYNGFRNTYGVSSFSQEADHKYSISVSDDDNKIRFSKSGYVDAGIKDSISNGKSNIINYFMQEVKKVAEEKLKKLKPAEEKKAPPKTPVKKITVSTAGQSRTTSASASAAAMAAAAPTPASKSTTRSTATPASTLDAAIQELTQKTAPSPQNFKKFFALLLDGTYTLPSNVYIYHDPQATDQDFKETTIFYYKSNGERLPSLQAAKVKDFIGPANKAKALEIGKIFKSAKKQESGAKTNKAISTRGELLEEIAHITKFLIDFYGNYKNAFEKIGDSKKSVLWQKLFDLINAELKFAQNDPFYTDPQRDSPKELHVKKSGTNIEIQIINKGLTPEERFSYRIAFDGKEISETKSSNENDTLTENRLTIFLALLNDSATKKKSGLAQAQLSGEVSVEKYTYAAPAPTRRLEPLAAAAGQGAATATQAGSAVSASSTAPHISQQPQQQTQQSTTTTGNSNTTDEITPATTPSTAGQNQESRDGALQQAIDGCAHALSACAQTIAAGIRAMRPSSSTRVAPSDMGRAAGRRLSQNSNQQQGVDGNGPTRF